MKVELYRDKQGHYRWRMKARNGKIVADCGEGYSSRKKCCKGLTRVVDAWSTGIEFVDLTTGPA
jgi:uncharacterized protein YegP (UPF0339 family)